MLLLLFPYFQESIHSITEPNICWAKDPAEPKKIDFGSWSAGEQNEVKDNVCRWNQPIVKSFRVSSEDVHCMHYLPRHGESVLLKTYCLSKGTEDWSSLCFSVTSSCSNSSTCKQSTTINWRALCHWVPLVLWAAWLVQWQRCQCGLDWKELALYPLPRKIKPK